MTRFRSLSILICVLAAEAGAQPVPLGPAFSVADGGIDRRNPALAWSNDGHVAVAWEQPEEGRDASMIFGRVFSPIGEPLSPVFAVSGVRSFEPAVVWGEAESFMIVWAVRARAFEPTTIRGRRFDRQGEPRGGEVVIATGLESPIEAFVLTSPEIVTLPDGYAVAWEGLEFDVRFDPNGWLGIRRLDALGHPSDLSGERRITTFRNGNNFEVRLSMAAGEAGNSLLVWSGEDLEAQRLDADTDFRGDEILIESTAGRGGARPSVAADAVGNFGVVWQRGAAGPGDDIFGRRYFANGNPQGPATQIQSSAGGGQSHPVVASNAEGIMTVVWENRTTENSARLRGQTYDLANRPVGGEFEISQEAPSQFHPAIASHPLGRFTVAWEQPIGDGRFNIRVRSFRLPFECSAEPHRLCLRDGRFALELEWQGFEGNGGLAQAVTTNSETGYFWYVDPNNIEMIVKVLDGTEINGHHWVFYGSLTNLEFTLRVTDHLHQTTKTYFNPLGQFASEGDTVAFPD